MGLNEDLRRIAEADVRYAAPGEEVVGIVPAEPSRGARAYLCAYRGEDGEQSWLVLDANTGQNASGNEKLKCTPAIDCM